MSVDTSLAHRAINAGLLLAALALPALMAPPALAQAVVQLEITGLSGELLDNVQAAPTIVRLGEDPTLDAAQITALREQAVGEIHRAMEPFGYYRPEIDSELLPPEDANGPWQLIYTVQAGTPVPLTAVDIRFTGPGARDADLLALPSQLPLQEATALDHREYESGRDTLVQRVKEQGYLDARYSVHRVEVDLASYTASVALHLETGPRYVFGPIELEQERFAPDYLRKYLILREGAPFSLARVGRQRAAFSRSGHFREVTLELGDAEPGEQPAIPVTIRLTPYKANRYQGGIGWGSDTGFGLQAGWTRRYLGRHGHNFSLAGTAVEERNRLAGDLRYRIPLDPLLGSGIELGARHESKDLTFEDVDLAEGGETRIATNLVSLFWEAPAQRLGKFELTGALGLSLVNETYDVFEVLFGNLPSGAQEDLIELIGQEAYQTLAPDFDAIVPGLRLKLRRIDDPLFIRRGDSVRLELLGTDEALGSNISFWQARLNTWNIWPVGDHSRLLLRSALGYTDAESRTVLSVNFNQMPEYYEFRAGGARSVRGYAYETLFPIDAITGGKHQLVASVEYEREFIPDWSAAVFLDAGNAFNDLDDFEEKLGTGIGIRWRSPVGLARIDLGFPLDDADDSFQIYITIGPEF